MPKRLRFHNYNPTSGEMARLLLDAPLFGKYPESLSVKEVAKRLGCSRSTVRNLIHQKKLAAFLIGGGDMRRHFRVLPSALAHHAIPVSPKPAHADPEPVS